MNRSIAIVASMIAATGSVALSGCTAPHPFIHDANANSVEITYSGDVASAWPLGREYCARFDREARLVDPGYDLAMFNCVGRRR